MKKADVNRASLFYQQFMKSIAGLIVLGMIALPLSGCGEHEGAGPIVSSLSTSTDAPPDGDDSVNAQEDSAQDSALDEPILGGEEPIDSPLTLTEESAPNSSTDPGPDPNESDSEEDSIASLIDAPQEKPTISAASTPTGAVASVTWESSSDPKVKGYYVYYGKQPSSDPGVCSYDDRIAADEPSVTITELEPNTPYFFAVSAYGRLESPCSEEATVITPPAVA